MSWYYKEGEQEIGPVTKAQLQELIHAKRINGKTLVRNASSNDWRPLAEMARTKAPANADAGQAPAPPIMPPVPPAAAPPEPAFPSPAEPPAAPVGTPPVESSVCSQCGRSFPKDQVVRFDNQVICAACKPIFVQRLREGVTMPGVLRYAGFWIRFGAKIIDGLIMVAAQYAILIPLGILVYSNFANVPENSEDMLSSGSLLLLGVQQLIGILIPAVYNTFFVGRFGATPGKMACRLKVVTAEGDKVTYARALGRNFAEWLSAIVLLIGYIMAAFDSEKRALHDRVCSTRVVYK
jgi:uncharacterized RDD family membrane protein YckC